MRVSNYGTSASLLLPLTAAVARFHTSFSFSSAVVRATPWSRPSAFVLPSSVQQQQQHNNKPYATISFSPSSSLFAVITGLNEEDMTDDTRGGVGLAQESAVKIIGTGTEPENMIRYTQVTPFDFAASANTAVKVLCKGMGKEKFQNPGTGTERNIVCAPPDAVRDALSSSEAMDNNSGGNGGVVLNFLGGDDLKIMEVVNAVQLVVEGLELGDDSKVTFNSLCHRSFPEEVCSVTVVSVADGVEDQASSAAGGVEGSVAKGELYFHSGKWYTVLEENINTANE